MANLATLNNTTLHFAEGSAPSTPDTGEWVVYTKTTGLFVMDDAGTEYGPLAAATSGAEFATGNAKVATAQATSSTSFADLATAGPSVTVTVGASGKVELKVSSRMFNDTANADCYVGVDISGASTVAAGTLLVGGGPVNKLLQFGTTSIVTGLTPGSTTFKMQYAVSAGAATFQVRELTVAPVL